jgi:hypothetical protein
MQDPVEVFVGGDAVFPLTTRAECDRRHGVFVRL